MFIVCSHLRPHAVQELTVDPDLADIHLSAPAELVHLLYHLSTGQSDTSLISTEAAYHALLAAMVRSSGSASGCFISTSLPAAGEQAEGLTEDEAINYGANTLYSVARMHNAEHREQELCIPPCIYHLTACILQLYDRVVMRSAPCMSEAHEFRVDGLSPAAVAVHEGQAPLEYYPHWPKLFHRPQYAQYEGADGKSKQPSDFRKCDTGAQEFRMGQNKWTPGLFLVCCGHGIIYGFHFLKHHESPNDFFTLLLTRFPRDQLPRVVAYDNGCKLHEFTLNRAPWMLRGGPVIMVDSFHFGGHQLVPTHKCPHAFDKSFQPAMNGFNTQYMECLNSVLCLFKSSLRTMKLATARHVLQGVVQRHNSRQIDGMHRQLHDMHKALGNACRWLGRAAAPDV